MAEPATGSGGVVDLRSDTVTRPDPAMRRAMAEAEVGDDVYGEDPTINALQAEVAALFGHEAALFVPSGSMGNQIALKLLVPPGAELLCDADAHVVTFELAAAAVHGQVATRTWTSSGGRFDPAAVAAMIRPPSPHIVPTAAVAVEQTHNMAGGAVQPIGALRTLREITGAAGVALHCDGARIWNAHVATGVPLAEYGALFETLSVCLSKGLGAPVGSLLVSSTERVGQARTLRKRLGGGMRQAGVLAAAGRYALAHNLERIAEDHARARTLAGLVGVDPATVDSNIVTVTVPSAAAVVASARAEGVLVGALGPRIVRCVTHLDVDDTGIERAGRVLAAALGGCRVP
ncbi:MAG TPA: GntG family PLP-dependent aldolase [Mycobacteriales bacterium]|nr:GntG family PLP-dependent aldolase [Mycobacteriales bacterium]